MPAHVSQGGSVAWKVVRKGMSRNVVTGLWGSPKEVLLYLYQAVEQADLPLQKLCPPQDGLDLADWIKDVTREACGGPQISATVWSRYALWAVWSTRKNGGNVRGRVPLTSPFPSLQLTFSVRRGLLQIKSKSS